MTPDPQGGAPQAEGSEQAKVSRSECSVPPDGWRCTRPAGHDGPCAAVQDGLVLGCPCCGGAGCEECGGTGSRVTTPLTVDGSVVMVHGNRLLDEVDRAALTEVYRAALERMNQPPNPPQSEARP